MARYRILKPVTYVVDGKVKQINKPPADGVELPDEVVAALGDKVQLIVETPEVPATETTTAPEAPNTTEAPAPETAPETPVETPAPENPTPSDAAPGGRVRGGKANSS